MSSQRPEEILVLGLNGALDNHTLCVEAESAASSFFKSAFDRRTCALKEAELQAVSGTSEDEGSSSSEAEDTPVSKAVVAAKLPASAGGRQLRSRGPAPSVWEGLDPKTLNYELKNLLGAQHSLLVPRGVEAHGLMATPST